MKVELELNCYLPPAERGPFSLRMILHGRRVCDAKQPACAIASLEDICPSSRLPRRDEPSVTTNRAQLTTLTRGSPCARVPEFGV